MTAFDYTWNWTILVIAFGMIFIPLILLLAGFSKDLIYPNGRSRQFSPRTHVVGTQIWYEDKDGNYRRCDNHEIANVTKVNLAEMRKKRDNNSTS